jgi:hypothetical protein
VVDLSTCTWEAEEIWGWEYIEIDCLPTHDVFVDLIAQLRRQTEERRLIIERLRYDCSEGGCSEGRIGTSVTSTV